MLAQHQSERILASAMLSENGSAAYNLRPLCRGRFAMLGVKRLCQLDLTAATGHGTVPPA
jgi:hypothetical protein